jgi:hypothetical protein
MGQVPSMAGSKEDGYSMLEIGRDDRHGWRGMAKVKQGLRPLSFVSRWAVDVEDGVGSA